MKNPSNMSLRGAERRSPAFWDSALKRDSEKRNNLGVRLLRPDFVGTRNDRRLIFLFVAAVLLIETSTFSQEAKIPKLFKRATDFTNTLSATELASLEQDLSRFEDSTSTQLTVVVIPTLGGESIEEFALRTAETNGIGQKQKDNGVLLLIAKDDRKIRIEVGYGLEGVLPDGLAGQIIRREITPYFRTGDYYAGVKAGVDAIMLATRNEYKADKKAKSGDSSPLFALLFFLLVMFFIMRAARRRTGVMGAALPLLIGSSLGHRSRGGWGGGGGGGGFGGFSGGGGSFGGGGASGGW